MPKINPVASNMTEMELNNGILVLFSYKTPVAAHVPGEGFKRTSKKWSVTTSRHINKWIKDIHGGSDKIEELPQSYFDSLN